MRIMLFLMGGVGVDFQTPLNPAEELVLEEWRGKASAHLSVPVWDVPPCSIRLRCQPFSCVPGDKFWVESFCLRLCLGSLPACRSGLAFLMGAGKACIPAASAGLTLDGGAHGLVFCLLHLDPQAQS